MKKVLIIGGGFAGLSALAKFSCAGGLEVTLLDKKSTFDFLPALPDILGERIAPRFLSSDLNRICQGRGREFIEAEASSIDLDKRQVFVSGRSFSYDYLIIASGTETNFYKDDKLEKRAYKLDTVSDAEKILEALRGNEFDGFVVGGGGYTGVEVATNIKRYCFKHKIDKHVRIVEKAPFLLGPLPEWIKSYVSSNLRRLGIEVLLGAAAEERPKEMLIWTAGVKTGDYLLSLGLESQPRGRFKTDKFLRIRDNCFAAGDTASFTYQGDTLRMAVQFAIAQGRTAASNILRDIKGLPLREYKPLDLGYIIPMANNLSCGEVFGFKVKGRLPTFLHYLMCLYRRRI